MSFVTSSIKFEKLLRQILFYTLPLAFCFYPKNLEAHQKCLEPLTVSSGTLLNESYFLLSCNKVDWQERDLIGIKSLNGDIVGLLQVSKNYENADIFGVLKKLEGPLRASQIATGEDLLATQKFEIAQEQETNSSINKFISREPPTSKNANQSEIKNRALKQETVADKVINQERVTDKTLNQGTARDKVVKQESKSEATDQNEIAAVGLDEISQLGDVLKLVSVRENRFLQKNDYLEKLDFSVNETELKGTSYLWKVKALPTNTKHRYRPLVTQGDTIGDTAQTLWKNEYYFTVFGTLGYGLRENISASANLPAFALGSPNGKIKTQMFRNTNQTWSVSLSMAQERNSSEKLFNVDLMWDSILSDTLIAHSLISAAVISFDSAKEVAALKSYGSSSIQTGYEYILSNWSRFLIGPSYNIDQKAIGGYVGYVKIINNLHIQTSLTTNNVREFKLSAKEGYFFILDAYWRW